MEMHNGLIKNQFNLRASTFDQSVHWVRDPGLIAAHLRLAGPGDHRQAVELCCGTGAVGRGLSVGGWDVTGVDISEGMVREAAKHIKAVLADVVNLPFASHSVDLVVMRQAYFLLDDGPAALKEIKRILKPTGRFILSHLVPFSKVDAGHLEKVHVTKQAQLRRFHTPETLQEDLSAAGFRVIDQDFAVVRESVSLWMRQAPELSAETQAKVCDLVVHGPAEYRQLREVAEVNGEIMENWNFVLLLASPV